MRKDLQSELDASDEEGPSSVDWSTLPPLSSLPELHVDTMRKDLEPELDTSDKEMSNSVDLSTLPPLS